MLVNKSNEGIYQPIVSLPNIADEEIVQNAIRRKQQVSVRDRLFTSNSTFFYYRFFSPRESEYVIIILQSIVFDLRNPLEITPITTHEAYLQGRSSILFSSGFSQHWFTVVRFITFILLIPRDRGRSSKFAIRSLGK